MTTPSRRSVEVWADWHPLPAPRLIGLLHATLARGKEVFSFEYDRAWLDDGPGQAIDPALQLYRGLQYQPEERDSFGVFLDSSPDRWGRVLMNRREAQRAREQSRPERKLLGLDYLLGVYDGHRLGGLRYRVAGGPFLDDDSELASPPWTSLRALEQASLLLERDGAARDPAHATWLRLLIAPGRSLGGARPKASVLDQRGRLWIAKFPSAGDIDDIGAWESVAYALAKRAGVSVPETRRQRFGSRHHTLVSRRFDRMDDGRRVHFASAMTMLQRNDGDEGASYLELAAVIIQHGVHVDRDLEQLWRRIAFFVCISNTDDHLRNHGFLLDGRGWCLAPAYDLNPIADGAGLTLNISETDNAQDLTLVREVAAHFRVKPRRADAIIGEVVAAVRRWRADAKTAGLPRAQQDRMAEAFRVAEPR